MAEITRQHDSTGRLSAMSRPAPSCRRLGFRCSNCSIRDQASEILDLGCGDGVLKKIAAPELPSSASTPRSTWSPQPARAASRRVSRCSRSAPSCRLCGSSFSSAGEQWTVNAYLVVSPACIVLGGQAADRFGVRLARTLTERAALRRSTLWRVQERDCFCSSDFIRYDTCLAHTSLEVHSARGILKFLPAQHLQPA
jgi:hypothetical protein